MSTTTSQIKLAAMLGLLGSQLVTAEASSISPGLSSRLSIPKGSTSNKYKPHQGKKEVARRLRQMKKGGAI